MSAPSNAPVQSNGDVKLHSESPPGARPTINHSMTVEEMHLVAEQKDGIVEDLLEKLAMVEDEKSKLKLRVSELEKMLSENGIVDKSLKPSPPINGEKVVQNSPRHGKLAKDAGTEKDSPQSAKQSSSLKEGESLPNIKVAAADGIREREFSSLNVKIPAKAIDLAGDQYLERKNQEHISESAREKLPSKVSVGYIVDSSKLGLWYRWLAFYNIIIHACFS